jgi:hypothetical protein
MATAPRISEILVTVILLVILAVVVMMGFLVYRVTYTVTSILDGIDRLVVRVESLEQKIDAAVPERELESFLDEVAVLQEGAGDESIQLKHDAEAEVRHLLRRIPFLAERYQYSGKNSSPLRFSAQIYAKYRTYRKTLTSAEDFITKVTTKTIGGNAYYAVQKDGSKRELAEVMREELEKYRAAQEGKADDVE